MTPLPRQLIHPLDGRKQMSLKHQCVYHMTFTPTLSLEALVLLKYFSQVSDFDFSFANNLEQSLSVKS